MSTRLRVRCQRERHRSLMVTCCLVRLARKNRVPPRPPIAGKPSGENLPTKSTPEGADRAPAEPSIVNIASSLHANDLVQCMYDLDQIFLRSHHRIDRLVSRWSLINHIGIFAAFDALGCRLVIRDCESPARLCSRHAPARAMATAHE